MSYAGLYGSVIGLLLLFAGLLVFPATQWVTGLAVIAVLVFLFIGIPLLVAASIFLFTKS